LLQVPGSKGTIGDALKGALTGWEYTLPLEFVRKGQAYVGPSLRLRRVMNDLMAGKSYNVSSPRVQLLLPMLVPDQQQGPCNWEQLQQ
jgi:hypothetical protein